MAENVNFLLNFGFGVLLVESSQGNFCFFSSVSGKKPVFCDLLVYFQVSRKFGSLLTIVEIREQEVGVPQ